jgi:hypothetical protein
MAIGDIVATLSVANGSVQALRAQPGGALRQWQKAGLTSFAPQSRKIPAPEERKRTWVIRLQRHIAMSVSTVRRQRGGRRSANRPGYPRRGRGWRLACISQACPARAERPGSAGRAARPSGPRGLGKKPPRVAMPCGRQQQDVRNFQAFNLHGRILIEFPVFYERAPIRTLWGYLRQRPVAAAGNIPQSACLIDGQKIDVFRQAGRIEKTS